MVSYSTFVVITDVHFRFIWPCPIGQNIITQLSCRSKSYSLRHVLYSHLII